MQSPKRESFKYWIFFCKRLFFMKMHRKFHIFYLSYFRYYKKAFLSAQNIVVFLIKWLDVILFFIFLTNNFFIKNAQQQSLNLPAWFQYSEKFITYVCTDAYMIILLSVFEVIHKPCGHEGGSPKAHITT